MKRENAFTLIELLVVIAVIALLMAILLPALARARRQAKAAACQSNLRQWGVIFFLYNEDNDGKFPRRQHFFLHAGAAWPYTLRAYYPDSNDLLLCPTASRPEVRPDNPWPIPSPISLQQVGSKSTAWKIKTRDPDIIFEGSYGLNENVDTEIYFLRRGSDFLRARLAARATVPVLLDCIYVNGRPLEWDRPPEYDDALGPRDGDMTYFCINRHDGGTNCLFLDWSVRKVGLKELWTLKWDTIFFPDNRWTKAGGVQPEDWPRWMRHFKDY